ncbi:MAG: hypothetical protein R3C19_05225 [Planctomycetaceae bacterium]
MISATYGSAVRICDGCRQSIPSTVLRSREVDRAGAADDKRKCSGYRQKRSHTSGRRKTVFHAEPAPQSFLHGMIGRTVSTGRGGIWHHCDIRITFATCLMPNRGILRKVNGTADEGN